MTAYPAEQQLRGLLSIIGTALVATLIVLLSSAAVAWAADRVSALDHRQASLLATLVALMVLYIFAMRLGEFAEGLEPVGAEGEEEDEEDEEVAPCQVGVGRIGEATLARGVADEVAGAHAEARGWERGTPPRAGSSAARRAAVQLPDRDEVYSPRQYRYVRTVKRPGKSSSVTS